MKQIAVCLVISGLSSVLDQFARDEIIRRRIMQKLNVANAAEMISRATELGFKANI